MRIPCDPRFRKIGTQGSQKPSVYWIISAVLQISQSVLRGGNDAKIHNAEDFKIRGGGLHFKTSNS